ncbi:hypothetical protein [Pseudomonas savastanoi]|uniref:hypothetical protein n=1 Tax=Pseudomonas savastanoi TaxID=29438 RepID=UPI000B2C235D|nr:hypothetical protein [Pseudomonas savastanoi]UKL11927.1 hypothetical protein HQ966_11380 [Pseudomonas savastanoi pv. savastanoi]
MWYSVSDGEKNNSFGFASKLGELRGEGVVVYDDDKGYQETLYEVTVRLTESQYNALIDFSKNPAVNGFDSSRYNVLSNSCVDFVYASLQVLGYNPRGLQGDLLPGNNDDNIDTLLHDFGAEIIRGDIQRHGIVYDGSELSEWLNASDLDRGLVNNDFSLNTDIASGIKYREAVDHDVAAAEVSQGLITSGGGWDLNYDANKLNANQYQGNWINNTFTNTATQILADGYRPGNVNTVKEVFDFSLRDSMQGMTYSNALATFLNSGDASARVTLPTDPLVLDLNGDGVRLTDYLAAPVLFDADNDGGSLEETGWVSPVDGIVVVDSNANGKIDNISETLSEYFGGIAGTDGNAGEKRFSKESPNKSRLCENRLTT